MGPRGRERWQVPETFSFFTFSILSHSAEMSGEVLFDLQ
jgi:hypothetical protein